MIESTAATVTVALDVAKSSARLAALRTDELLDERTLPYDFEAIESSLARWPGARVCYEAGPTGFGLHRHLVAAGIDCSVVAPGLIPQRPSERIKTDARDARKLARLHQGGLLEAVYVPSPELEAARDLVRAREDARLDRMRARQRMSGFLLRQDRRMPTSFWGATRRRWLGEQSFEHPAQQITFGDYLLAIDLVDRRIADLEAEILATAEKGSWGGLVSRLRCLRGVDTLTALGIVCEVGDFGRFETAAEFMAFTGLVPSERSSGERRRQGSITKSGSSHLRRLLIESAWHSRRPPKVSYELSRRQQGQEAAVCERAWRAQRRLHSRWARLAARGKPQQKIVVACARELAGFVWAITTEQPLAKEA